MCIVCAEIGNSATADIGLAIVSGLATAVAWAVFVWAYTSWRDKRLRQKIHESLSAISLLETTEGHGLGLKNDTHVSIIVREVKLPLIATKDHPGQEEGKRAGFFSMNYVGPQKSRSCRRVSDESGNVRGFVELPPYTGGNWIILNTSLCGNFVLRGTHFDGVYIKVEYLTLFKMPKLLEVKLEGEKHESGVPYALNKTREDWLAGKFVLQGNKLTRRSEV